MDVTQTAISLYIFYGQYNTGQKYKISGFPSYEYILKINSKKKKKQGFICYNLIMQSR